jgi:hypothetical protein
VPTIDLPADELAAVTAAIRGVIEDDKFPLSPRLDPLRAALARLEAAAAAGSDQSEPSKSNANKNSDAVKAGSDKSEAPKPIPDPNKLDKISNLKPKAPPPAKADKRARR